MSVDMSPDNQTASTQLGFILWLGIALSLICGVLVSPEWLIEVGIMKKSLTSTLGNVKEVAHLEVAIFKWLCIFIAVVLVLVLIFKGRIVEFLLNQDSVYPNGGEDFKGTVFNFSFYIVFGLLLISILYISFGGRFLTDLQLQIANREDGVIEYVSAVLFFIAGLLSLYLGKITRNHFLKKSIFIFFGLLFLFTAGEEISWGQRIFQIETLEIFEGANVQNENNIHNMFGYLFDHAFISFVFIFGFVIPLLSSVNIFIRKSLIFLGVPVASMGLALGFFAVSFMQDFAVSNLLPPLPHLRIAELRELLTALCFVLLFVEQWCKQRSTSASVT